VRPSTYRGQLGVVSANNFRKSRKAAPVPRSLARA
jgi:hypothetical protein